VESAQQNRSVEESNLARNMAKNSLNSSANSVARFHNGSAGETLISVKNVIRSSVVVITCHGRRRANSLSAQA
jgi:hypothetical protein